MAMINKKVMKSTDKAAAKKLEGVTIDGIQWYPEVVKKMKKEEFVEAHICLPAFKPKEKQPRRSGRPRKRRNGPRG